MRNKAVLFLSFLILLSCSNEDENKIINPVPPGETILSQLEKNYHQLPEKEIVISDDGRFYAQYSNPTTEYRHGILGDDMEGKQLVVVADSVFNELVLEDDYVFEDIRPRLVDINGDNRPEIITIRTNKSLGAGIMIYKIVENRLTEFAYVKEIGRTYRWLNIVAINDLDNDGIVELVWIETPHIGGTLKIAKIKSGALQVIDQKTQFSNHVIGERNLCLSVLTEQNGSKVFYIPTQKRDKIVGFSFIDNQLEVFEEISQNVDFSQSLVSQYAFKEVLEEGNHCN